MPGPASQACTQKTPHLFLHFAVTVLKCLILSEPGDPHFHFAPTLRMAGRAWSPAPHSLAFLAPAGSQPRVGVGKVEALERLCTPEVPLAGFTPTPGNGRSRGSLPALIKPFKGRG